MTRSNVRENAKRGIRSSSAGVDRSEEPQSQTLTKIPVKGIRRMTEPRSAAEACQGKKTQDWCDIVSVNTSAIDEKIRKVIRNHGKKGSNLGQQI